MKNYVNLIQRGTLFDSMGNTIKYTLFVVVWGNVQALVLAFILNMKLRARGAFRTIFYIPALFSTIVVAFLWKAYAYFPHYGMIAEIFETLGLSNAPNFLGSKETSLFAAAFVETWKNLGNDDDHIPCRTSEYFGRGD